MIIRICKTNSGLISVVLLAMLFGTIVRGEQTEGAGDTNDGFRIIDQTINMTINTIDKTINTILSIPPKNSAFSVYWENDGTFMKPDFSTDRHYTDGFKIVYAHQPDSNWLKGFGRWNNFADKDTNVSTAVGYFFGQNMYTPDHADNPEERVSPDRVFAGWLYWGIFAQRATTEKMEHLELNFGLLGPSALGGPVQNFIHNLVGVNKPKGWDDQLGDEFHTDLTWFQRRRADVPAFQNTENFDTHLEYGFTAGTLHRNAIASILFRWGNNLPNDFGPGRLEAPSCYTMGTDKEQKDIYFFARFGGKLVQFDRFLTGLDTNPAVGVMQLGIAAHYKSFEISYSQTFLTKEYREQPSADSYASLNLTYHF